MKNKNDLITRIQLHYQTNYNPTQIEDIKHWLDREGIADANLQGFYDLIIDNFKFYKSLPDCNDLNNIKDMAIEQRAERNWSILETELKSDRSILCTDLILQETIRAMGGVNAFLDNRLNNRSWCRKDFIQTYKRQAQIKIATKHSVLKSNHHIQYKKNDEQFFLNDVKVIGNEGKGKELLLEMSKNQKLEYSGRQEIEFKTGEDLILDMSKEK